MSNFGSFAGVVIVVTCSVLASLAAGGDVTYRTQEVHSLEQVTSGTYSINVQLNVPGDINFQHEDNMESPVLEVHVEGPSRAATENIDIILSQDDAVRAIQVLVEPRPPPTPASVGNSLGHNRLVYILGVFLTWGIQKLVFKNTRSAGVLVMLLGLVALVVSLDDSRPVRADVLIRIPPGFTFTDVTLINQAGTITAAPHPADTPALCAAGGNLGCEQCCHGRGSCSSNDDHCACAAGLADQTTCSPDTGFYIQNLWSHNVQERFVIKYTHDLYQQISRNLYNGVQDHVAASVGSTSIRITLDLVRKTVADIGNLAGEDGAWVIGKKNCSEICLLSDYRYVPDVDDELVLMLWSMYDVYYDYAMCDDGRGSYSAMETEIDTNATDTSLIYTYRVEHEGYIAEYYQCLPHDTQKLAHILGLLNDTVYSPMELIETDSELSGQTWSLLNQLDENIHCILVNASDSPSDVMEYLPPLGDKLVLENVAQHVTYPQCSQQAADANYVGPVPCEAFAAQHPGRMPLRITVENHISGTNKDFTLTMCVRAKQGESLAAIISQTAHMTENFNFRYNDYGGELGWFVEEINGVAGSFADSTFWSIQMRDEQGMPCATQVGMSFFYPSPGQHIVLRFSVYGSSEPAPVPCPSLPATSPSPEATQCPPYVDLKHIPDPNQLPPDPVTPGFKVVRVIIQNDVTKDPRDFLISLCILVAEGDTLTDIINYRQTLNITTNYFRLDTSGGEDDVSAWSINDVRGDIHAGMTWMWMRRYYGSTADDQQNPSASPVMCRLSAESADSEYVPVHGEVIVLMYGESAELQDQMQVCEEVTDAMKLHEDGDYCFV